jgi:hypothetical protein
LSEGLVQQFFSKLNFSIPEYFGAKSSMFDLLPGTVIPLKPIEMVNMMMAASALHPMYPAMTTVMAGT